MSQQAAFGNFVSWHNVSTLKLDSHLQARSLVSTRDRKHRYLHLFLLASQLSPSLHVRRYRSSSSDAQRRTGKSPAWHLKTPSLFSLTIPVSFPSPWALYLNYETYHFSPMSGPVYLPLCLLRVYFLCLKNALNSLMKQLEVTICFS